MPTLARLLANSKIGNTDLETHLLAYLHVHDLNGPAERIGNIDLQRLATPPDPCRDHRGGGPPET